MSILNKLDYRYIYVLGNTRYWFRYKIGIARNLENRTRGIENSMKGDIYEIFSLKVLFAQKIEKSLHAFYNPLNATMRGSGKTEWFWMILPISPILYLLFVWALQLVLVPTFISFLAYIFLHYEQILGLVFN